VTEAIDHDIMESSNSLEHTSYQSETQGPGMAKTPVQKNCSNCGHPLGGITCLWCSQMRKALPVAIYSRRCTQNEASTRKVSSESTKRPNTEK